MNPRWILVGAAAWSLASCTRQNPDYDAQPGSDGSAESSAGSVGPATVGVDTGPTVGSADSAGSAGGCADPSFYPDLDEDGFGDPDGEARCEPAAGRVDNHDDCDDSDPRVRPGGLLCPSSPDLVAWLSFDEQRPPYMDRSGNGNHGLDAADGGPITGEDWGGFPPAVVFIDQGHSVDLDEAVADLIEPSGIAPAGTIELWARADMLPVDCPRGTVHCADIVLYLGSPDGDGFGPSGAVHIHVLETPMGHVWQGRVLRDAGTACTAPTDEGLAEAVVDVGEWVHLAFAWQQGSECKLYVDGQPLGSQMVDAIGGPWSVGRVARAPEVTQPANPRYFGGAVDEIMIFSDVRSADEILSDCWLCG